MTGTGNDRAPVKRTLCHACGAARRPSATTCGLCESPASDADIESVDPAEDPYWVAVRCTFTCRVCGHDSALNHFDVDGSVACTSCGTEQKFNPNQWRDLVEHAEGVGDLAGPVPEGRRRDGSPSVADDNPFAQIGRDWSFAEWTQGETTVESHCLVMRAAPGHPLSPAKAPLEIALRSATEITLRCPTTLATETYVVPPKARKHGALAVVAAEHVKGLRDARLLQETGAIAIVCPQCAAPLAVTAVNTVVACAYCKTSSLIPARARRSLGAESTRPSVWWMLFEGPSRTRREIVEDAAAAAREEADGRAKAERQKAWRQDREHEAAETRDRNAAAEQAKRAEMARRKRLQVIVPVVISIAAIGVAVGSGLIRRSNNGPDATATAATVAPRSVQPIAAPERPSVELVWSAKVKSVQGKPFAVGELCHITVQTNLKQIEGLVVKCKGEVLYDATVRAAGMSNKSWGFYEEVGPEPGTFQYGISYQDLGTRTGRAQLQWMSQHREARVSEPNMPSFEVVLQVDAASAPRKGAPLMFSANTDLAAKRVDAVVDEIEGLSDPPVGTACTLDYRVVRVQDDGHLCHLSLHCGKAWIYPGKEAAGLSQCTPIPGALTSIADRGSTAVDGDPQFELVPELKRATVRDERDGKATRISVHWK